MTERNKERNRNLIGIDKDGNRIEPMAAEESNNLRPDFYGADNIYQEYLRNRVFKNEKVMELKRNRHTQQETELREARAKLVSISEVLQKIQSNRNKTSEQILRQQRSEERELRKKFSLKDCLILTTD